jgi:hypothetical protein
MTVRFIGSKEDTVYLTSNNIYMVIGIESGYYRIMDDVGEPILFDPQWFNIIDPEEPDDWVIMFSEDGEKYAYPPQISVAGFFEDYFDGDQGCFNTLQMYLQQMCANRKA